MDRRQKGILGRVPQWDGMLAFLLPALLLLAAYSVLGVYPFGDKSLLLVDMHNEYIDYFSYMNRTIRGDGSFLRSWEMGMGLNMVGLIAFYTASGLNLLLLLTPLEWLTEVVLALTLVKVGLCGLTFRWYARGTFGDSVARWTVLAAAVAYALCGYNLAYSSNIMWLDGVAMLPLVCLGAEKLLRQGNVRFFTGCLIYTFLSSYYIGYMIGIFSFLYFTVRYFENKNNIMDYFCKLKWFVGAAVLAAACCAFLLLPAFLQLRGGQSGMWQVSPSLKLMFTPSQLGLKLLPGSYDSLTNAGLPNLYTTVGGVFCAGLFFGAGHISRREKMLMGGLLAFLLLSMCWELLDLAWHAFEDPTWFPTRYSFVFSFFVLHLALRAMQRHRKLTGWAVCGSALVLLLLFLEAGTNRVVAQSAWLAVLGAALIIAYTILINLQRRGWGTLAAGVALLLIMVESGANSVMMVQGMEAEFGYKTRQSFVSYREMFLPAVEWVQHNDEGISRMEVVQQRSANGSMGLGYRGISHYSTTTDQSLNAWLRAMGYNTGTINELRFAKNTPVTNGLVGIRYVASTEPMGEGYDMVHTAGNVNVYHNTLAFPLAFGADRDALDWAGDMANPFRYQNELLGVLDGSRDAGVFTPVEVVEVTLEQAIKSQSGETIMYHVESRTASGVITYTLHNPTGNPVYAYLPVAGRRFSRTTAYVNGEKIGRELSYRANTVLSLGAGQSAELRLEVESGSVSLRGEYFYALDLGKAEEIAGQAEANGMSFTRFDDTYISGKVTMPQQGGALATTIPYDDGWRIWVDGKKVEPAQFAGVFLALDLQAGEHQIVMRYAPPGFITGCIISITAIAGWLLVAWYLRGRKEKDRLR